MVCVFNGTCDPGVQLCSYGTEVLQGLFRLRLCYTVDPVAQQFPPAHLLSRSWKSRRAGL